MLGQISTITNRMCQVHHQTLPQHPEFNKLKPNNYLKQVKQVIRFDYGDDYFTLRMQDKVILLLIYH